MVQVAKEMDCMHKKKKKKGSLGKTSLYSSYLPVCPALHSPVLRPPRSPPAPPYPGQAAGEIIQNIKLFGSASATWV